MKTLVFLITLLSILVIPIASQRQCRSNSECTAGFCCAFTFIKQMSLDSNIVYQTCRNQTLINSYKNELHVLSLSIFIPSVNTIYYQVFEITYCLTANSTSNLLGY